MFGQLVNSLDLSGGLEIWGQYFWARINPTASPKIPSNLWNTKIGHTHGESDIPKMKKNNKPSE
jgi:hypothetical protein